MDIPNPLESLGEIASSLTEGIGDISPSIPDISPDIDIAGDITAPDISPGIDTVGDIPAGQAPETGPVLINEPLGQPRTVEKDTETPNLVISLLGQSGLFGYVDRAIVDYSHELDNRKKKRTAVVPFPTPESKVSLRAQLHLPETDSQGFRYFEITPERLSAFMALRELNPTEPMAEETIQLFRDCLAEEIEDIVTNPDYRQAPDDEWPAYPELLRNGTPVTAGVQAFDKLARICNDVQVPPNRFWEMSSEIFEAAPQPAVQT